MSATATRLREVFPLFEIPEMSARFNIAPTQMVLAARRLGEEEPKVTWLRWGLVPSWAKDKKISASLINARSDTVVNKPAFRTSFKRRRCLILADGFYEWRQGPGKAKYPYHIRRQDGAPFAFAGLWEKWEDEQQVIESCCIITTDANDAVRPVHHRMPVILPPTDFGPWLDSRNADTSLLQEMLASNLGTQLQATAVGPFVNNARHEGADCLTVVEATAQ